MAAVKNDLPLRELREATEKVAPEARRKAFGYGVSVVYAKDGKIVSVSADGTVSVVASSFVRDVVVRKRV